MEDARSAQCTAETITAGCQRELAQVSSSLAAQLEAEAMWQGRAQGLQQQLDQAMQGQQQLQQGMAAAEASLSDHQHTSRCASLGLITFVLTTLAFLLFCDRFGIITLCANHAILLKSENPPRAILFIG